MLSGPLREKINFVELVADDGVLNGFLPLGHFTRFCEQINEIDGEVSLALRFLQDEQQRIVVEGDISTTVELTCQACVQDMSHSMTLGVRTVLVVSAAELEGLGQEEDGIIVVPPLVSLRDLLEDELIVGLPMAPRHESCPTVHHEIGIKRDRSEPQTNADLANTEEREASGRETHRPFADLQGLLDGSRDRQESTEKLAKKPVARKSED